MSVATHLAYLWILYVFVNRPGYLGRIRHAFVLLYALGKVAQPWSLSTIASLLVLIPFLSWFPGTPQFGSQALANVLLALYLDFIYLHLPVQPNSPLFLLRPDQALPLAVLAWRGLRALFIPPLFFLPGLILSLMLLSQTLQRWLLWTWSFNSLVGGPTDTQITFMYLLLTMFLLLCISLIYAVIVNPFLAASQGPESSPWDRYTRSVGMEARRAFIHTVRLYGTENHIPAPLNLLQVVFVRIPQFTLERLRKRDAAARIAAFDKVLWRITVGPAAFLLSALWLWYLRAY
ncbi:hypothetical protein TRAPUB_2212 [Trametes pubescens]|uniref:Uncharacterized protein n=1 Tax=Trametes pubescens TaxID=154538 RepID=A0A1M2VH80_TRAPU|nr:hypothetical protein TRAPUB_2212 [Trametes pubescens]